MRVNFIKTTALHTQRLPNSTNKSIIISIIRVMTVVALNISHFYYLMPLTKWDNCDCISSAGISFSDNRNNSREEAGHHNGTPVKWWTVTK